MDSVLVLVVLVAVRLDIAKTSIIEAMKSEDMV